MIQYFKKKYLPLIIKYLSFIPQGEFMEFKTHPIKYPVGGTIPDIIKITKEDLYNCYNTQFPRTE